MHPAMMQLQYQQMSTMQPSPTAAAGIPTAGYHPALVAGYQYYPTQTMMGAQQQYLMTASPNVLAQQFPAIQQHPVQQPGTPTTQTQLPAPIQAMAAPFQPGIAPPPLTPQSSTPSQPPQGTCTPQQGPTATQQARPPSAVESDRPQSAPGVPQVDPVFIDDQYDHRCSLCIAAWGFAFLSGLTGSAGLLFLQQGRSFKTLGYVLVAVSITFALSMLLFLPASRKYSNKIPVHRQCLPFLLVLITSGELCWVVYLIAQTPMEAKGLLVALVAFLGVFWCSLWKIMCLRCCCHRRRISKQKKAMKMETKRRKRMGSDNEEQFEDFHHVNTQVRETLRNRFNESILQQTILQSAAPTIAIGSDASALPSFVTLQQPSAPPADTPLASATNQGTLTTFSTSQTTSGLNSAPTQTTAPSQVHDPPPYDAVYRGTPPPPYSALV